MRHYDLMREILIKASSQRKMEFSELAGLIKNSFYSKHDLIAEVVQLSRDSLIFADIKIGTDGVLLSGEIRGLTTEGIEFLRLIENSDVWEICSRTLKDAKVDLPYSLLKDVCEEILRRYTFSKIPSDN
jgi:hypothetical protein